MSIWETVEGSKLDEQGMNDGNIQMFIKTPVKSLLRENIQNSLDVAKNQKEPVFVEMKYSELASENYPDREGFLKILSLIKNTPTWKKDVHVKELVEQSESVLNSSVVPVLRFSDFNTTGADGATETDPGNRNPWMAMTVIKGTNVKNSEGSAGSYGIGKNANKAASDLRTVFYATQTEKEGTHSIGILDAATYINPVTQKVSQKVYKYQENGHPIEGDILAQSLGYERGEPGTDIYIMGFSRKDDYIQNAIKYVIQDFMVSIYRGILTVKIEDEIINKENLHKVIGSLPQTDSESIKIINYYEAIHNKGNAVVSLPEEFSQKYELKSDEASLYFDGQDDLPRAGNRKVLMTRASGMKIYEMTRFDAGIQFSGVFVASGERINEILKKMEDPEHSTWQGDIYPDKKFGERFIKDLTRFIRDTINTTLKEEFDDETVGFGVSEFLPLEEGEEDKRKRLEKEKIATKIDSIEIKKRRDKKPKLAKGPLQRGPKTKTNQPAPKPNPDSNKQKKKRIVPELGNQVSIAKDWLLRASDGYRYVLSPAKAMKSGAIELFVVGEKAKKEVPKVRKCMIYGIEQKVIDNKVFFNIPIKKGSQLVFDIEMESMVDLGMEVKLYETKV